MELRCPRSHEHRHGATAPHLTPGDVNINVLKVSQFLCHIYRIDYHRVVEVFREELNHDMTKGTTGQIHNIIFLICWIACFAISR